MNVITARRATKVDERSNAAKGEKASYGTADKTGVSRVSESQVLAFSRTILECGANETELEY